MKIITIRLATFWGMTAVILGAYGAHGLSLLLEPPQLETFKTGVLYHFIHALAILAIGQSSLVQNRILKLSAFFFSLGIILFSGSLYLLSCRDILGIASWKFLGPITPIGGIFYILGWLSLLFIKSKRAG